MIAIAAAFALCFGVSPTVYAMHIMEGYLPPKYCIAWGALCIPFLIAGYFSIKKTISKHHRSITMLAMAGAFVFCPFVIKDTFRNRQLFSYDRHRIRGYFIRTKCCKYSWYYCIDFSKRFYLLMEGLTTLGANTFSMAIAGPFVSFGIYKLFQKFRVNPHIGIFMAAFIGDLFTYCVTSIQLALAYPSTNGGVPLLQL